MRLISARTLARRWPLLLDGACDGLVLSFAGWTLFYQLALALQFSMLWAGWPYLLMGGAISVVCALRQAAVGDGGGAADQGEAPPPVAFRWPPMVAAAVLLVLLALGRGLWGVWPVAVVAIVVLAAQLWPWYRLRRSEPAARVRTSDSASPGSADSGRSDSGASADRPSTAAHAFALVASVGFGVVGCFLLRPDPDDVFYVNRATWVATHGTAALNDTMFGPNTQPMATSAGIPTPSVEAAQGVIAHALGMQAPSFCYLLLVPLLGALAGWTTWRLIRQWAQRRWALAMAAAVLFLLSSGDSVIGNYSLGRIWQGKAAGYLILLPLVWLFLSRATAGLRRGNLLMLAGAGIAFVGLTTSSSLLAPLVAGAALMAALLLRSISLAVGALAFVAAPVVNGLVQFLAPTAIGGGETSVSVPARAAFDLAFGHQPAMALLGLAAIVLAPRLIPGRTGVLLGCGAVATMVALLPGVFALADLVTGAGPVMWRLVIALPTWVLVSLLATGPELLVGERSEQGGGRWVTVSAAVTALVFLVPVLFGSWLWSGENAQLTRRPTWKVDQAALADVRAARKLDVPPGRWLMPPVQMEILAISTIEPSAVVPRAYYLGNLDLPAQELSDRVALYRLASGMPVPTETIKGAIDRLDVSLACVDEQDLRSRELLSEAVGAKLERIEQMRCHVRDGS